VHLHYDELAQWLVEAGISRDRIWSSQGLMAPLGDAMPFAVDLTSAPRNYDSGGMSIAGAKPALGHLGVILYGEAAVNDVRMDNGKSLFATLAAVDPKWAIVEYNTSDLRNPAVPPGYPAAYRGLRDTWNFGARYMSPMAWNGSNGLYVGQPGYSTFTAWRNTSLESAAKDFMLARMGLPLGAVLYTFGTPSHADGDGWTSDVGAFALNPGYLTIGPMRTIASRSCHRKDCLRKCGGPRTSCWASTGRRACAACASGPQRAGCGWEDASGCVGHGAALDGGGNRGEAHRGRSRARDRSGAHRDHVRDEYGEGADARMRDALPWEGRYCIAWRSPDLTFRRLVFDVALSRTWRMNSENCSSALRARIALRALSRLRASDTSCVRRSSTRMMCQPNGERTGCEPRRS
jgi:hypothetical protein